MSPYKRPMGHIAHLRNSSNQKHKIIVTKTLSERDKKKSPFWELNDPYL